MNKLLARQLKKFELSEERLPQDAQSWQLFLKSVEIVMASMLIKFIASNSRLNSLYVFSLSFFSTIIYFFISTPTAKNWK